MLTKKRASKEKAQGKDKTRKGGGFRWQDTVVIVEAAVEGTQDPQGDL